MNTQACPCGAAAYAQCCEPFHNGRAWPPTAEALMRSRYSAFALGLADYLWRTWHPRTRPSHVHLDDTVWTGLEIVEVVDGTEADQDGVVEFIASFRQGRRASRVRERSRFERRAGCWMYVDAE